LPAHGAGSSGGPQAAVAAAAQHGALQGVFATAATATAGAEADPLSGAAAGVGSVAAQAASASASAPAASGVGMQDMIESIHATIELAARQGATQARIALHPEELGHISIRLSQTSEGLLARVSAETPAAAQALMSGRAELHQSLSSLGLPLLRLDISSFGQSEAGQREGGSAGGSDGSRDTSAVRASDDDSAATAAELEGAPAAPTTSIAGGALVDVLA
jgi:flagellar hook-length control protein FliK